MVRHIVHTIITRALTLFISFPLLFLSTRYLGAYGRGLLSLLMAAVGMQVLINGFVGGESLVYLLPKNRNKAYVINTVIISTAWTLISCTVISCSYFALDLAPSNILPHIVIIGIIASLFNTWLMLLLAGENITKYNFLTLTTTAINLLIFSTCIYAFSVASVGAYLLSMYASYIIGLSVAIILFLRSVRDKAYSLEPCSVRSTIREIWKYSCIAQLGNFIQYVNYRFSYFALSKYLGLADVGVYSVGTVIAESILMISGSMSLVQYSKIANAGDTEYAKNLTIALAKAGFVVTAIVTILFLAVPASIITDIFGREFYNVRSVVLSLSIGIVSLGFSMMISHYFAGIGRYHVCTIASGIGLIVTIVGNLALIPKFGYIGAGLAASGAYVATSAFLLYSFLKFANIGVKSLCIRVSDFNVLREAVRSHFAGR